MKKFRLIFIIGMLVAVMAFLSFGVYSNLKDPTGVTNKVVFNRGDDNVFLEIKSQYAGPDLEEGLLPTYEFKLNREEASAYTNQNVIPAWNLGATNFTTLETEISLTFTIKNINGAGNGIAVAVTDFAFDESVNKKFVVSYYTAADEEALETAEATEVQDTTEAISFSIEDGHQVVFKIVYKLKKFDKKFQFDNNLKMTFVNQPAD